MDDAEGLEESIDGVDHKQEEARGREEREDDGAETPPRGCAVDGGGFNERTRDGVQPGEEEEEIVGNLFPRGGHHEQEERLIPVDLVVPRVAEVVQGLGQDAAGRVEEKEPEHARERRRDGVGDDEHGFVERAAPVHLIREHGEEQGRAHRQHDGGEAEHERQTQRFQVAGIGKEGDEIVESHEFP